VVAIVWVLNICLDSINIDVYANAFNFNLAKSPHMSDNRIPPMTERLWEGKYELDSLAWVCFYFFLGLMGFLLVNVFVEGVFFGDQ